MSANDPNLGALTAIYTPAAACANIVWQYNYTSNSNQKFLSFGATKTSSCYPTNFKTASTAFYSPGICPSGWSSACGSTEAVGTVTETRATCCPSGYTCQTDTDLPWSTLNCVSAVPTTGNILVTTTSGSTTTTTTLKGPGGVQGFGVNIRWRDSDFTTTGPTNTATTSGNPTSTSPNGGETSAASSGLSTGAKAGIGVGVTLGVIALIAAIAIFAFTLRRKKRNNPAEAAPILLAAHHHQDQKYQAYQPSVPQSATTTAAPTPGGLQTPGGIAELHSPHVPVVRHELE